MNGEIGRAIIKSTVSKELMCKDSVIIPYNVCTEKYTFSERGLRRYVDEDRSNIRTGEMYSPMTVDFEYQGFTAWHNVPLGFMVWLNEIT